MIRGSLAVAVVAACGTAANPAVVDNRVTQRLGNCDGQPCVEVAQRLQRGKGVARDYVAAAAALRRGCDAGESRSCRMLITDETSGLSREDVAAIARTGCTLGDPAACLVVEIMAEISRPDQEVEPTTSALDDAIRAARRGCDAGDVEVCQLVFSLGVFASTDCGSSCSARRETTLRELCGRGSLAACNDLVVSAQHRGEPRPTAALAMVVAACDDGDATACEVLPGRAIAPGELCRAGALDRCADAAAAGDIAAGEHGCSAGQAGACQAAAVALRDSATPDLVRARALFLRSCMLETNNAAACPGSANTQATPRPRSPWP